MRNLLFAGLIGLTLIACKEETIVSSVSGQLNINCSTPMAAREVAFKANQDGSFSEPVILASAITGPGGYFRFTYELEETQGGTANLILVEDTGFTTIISELAMKKDKELNLFINNTSTIKVKLEGTRSWMSTDTLFYGLNQIAFESSIVQPSNGFIDTIQARVPNSDGIGAAYTFYYGVGRHDFDSAKTALNNSNSQYQNISLNLEGCSESEQVEMTIN